MRLACVTTILALPAICFGDLSTSVSGFSYFGGIGFLANCGASDGSTASCSSGGSGVSQSGIPVTGSVQGLATAGYGSLLATVRAASSVGYEPFPNNFSDVAGFATAGFSDNLTILGGSGIGYIRYFFDGSIFCVSDIGGCGFTVKQDSLPPEGLSVPCIMCLDRSLEPFTFQTTLLSFTFGVPFTLDVGTSIMLTGNVGETSTFGTTEVNLVAIEVLNQNQQAIPFSITSASGATYPSQVPEPSSLVLGATLVGLICGVIRKGLKVGASPQ